MNIFIWILVFVAIWCGIGGLLGLFRKQALKTFKCPHCRGTGQIRKWVIVRANKIPVGEK